MVDIESDVEIENNHFPHSPEHVAIAKRILEIAQLIAPNMPEVRAKIKEPIGIFYDDQKQHSYICGERYRELLGEHSGDVTLGEPAEELIDLAAMMWKRLNGNSQFDKKIGITAEGLTWQTGKHRELLETVEQAALDYCLDLQEEAGKKKPGKRNPQGPDTDTPDESRRPEKSPDEPEIPDAPPDMNPETPENPEGAKRSRRPPLRPGAGVPPAPRHR